MQQKEKEGRKRSRVKKWPKDGDITRKNKREKFNIQRETDGWRDRKTVEGERQTERGQGRDRKREKQTERKSERGKQREREADRKDRQGVRQRRGER